jgi:hypothetical protein
MNRGMAFRGQPLLLFIGVIASWSSVRAMTWHAPEASAHSARAQVATPADVATDTYYAPAAPSAYGAAAMTWARPPFEDLALAQAHSARIRAMWEAAGGPATARQVDRRGRPDPVRMAAIASGGTGMPDPAAGYRLPMAADLWDSPLSGAMQADFEGNGGLPSGAVLAANSFIPPPLAGDADSPARMKRFSIDSWMLLRRDRSSAPAAIGGSYGRSQTGTVLRYELKPGSPFQPRAYIRGTRSLEGPQEGELAAGLSGRPVPGLPVLLAGEMRYYRTPTHQEFRPSVYAVTQFQPQHLPMDFRAETYFQGGYVGGQFATPFIDGQVRVDRKFFQFGDVELRGGGGMWGGAQKGAQRLDVGPGMSVYFGNGTVHSRLSLDYRFRVAGDAAPASGPALTLSAGF